MWLNHINHFIILSFSILVNFAAAFAAPTVLEVYKDDKGYLIVVIHPDSADPTLEPEIFWGKESWDVLYELNITDLRTGSSKPGSNGIKEVKNYSFSYSAPNGSVAEANLTIEKVSAYNGPTRDGRIDIKCGSNSACYRLKPGFADQVQSSLVDGKRKLVALPFVRQIEHAFKISVSGQSDKYVVIDFNVIGGKDDIYRAFEYTDKDGLKERKLKINRQSTFISPDGIATDDVSKTGTTGRVRNNYSTIYQIKDLGEITVPAAALEASVATTIVGATIIRIPRDEIPVTLTRIGYDKSQLTSTKLRTPCALLDF